jgi:plasmid stabilization system protein ParE
LERSLRRSCREEESVTNELIIITVAAVALIVVIAAWAYSVKIRRERLKQRFGPEYERAVESLGTPAKAEAVLEERAARVSRFNLHPLSPEQAAAFEREWRSVQARFVDTPEDATRDADRLVTEVMSARGYPVEDFDTRANDLSVDHPRVVENYRVARRLAIRRQRGEAGTEELRQAVVNYRALFDDLLHVAEPSRRRAS